MSCLPGGLGCVSKGFGVRRHAVAACIAGLVVLLTGCLHGENKPYLMQVDCASVFEDQTYRREVRPFKQLVTLWYSDGTSTQEVRPGQCFQEKKVSPLQP